mmetsp:Transcript_9207/g.13839  ORF Transcript_9207/g.13839 Transcript_9207/m.13839 type:complete len:153 (+) Transcript_9207:34-492(+)
MAPRWEQLLRLRLLGAPRHFSANDGASSLLVTSWLVLAACLALGLLASSHLRWAAFSFAPVFSGLAIQQYHCYTVHIFSECWADEGHAVTAIIFLTSALLSLIVMLTSVLLSTGHFLVFYLLLSVAMLSSYRWAPWGSLFDGTDKYRDSRRD